MKRHNIRFLQRLMLTGLGLILVNLFGFAQAQMASPIPFPDPAMGVSEPFLQCIPELRNYPDRYILLATSFEDKAYYTIGVNQQHRPDEGVQEDDRYNPPPELRYWETTVAFDSQGQCSILIGRQRTVRSLLQVMPETPANQLALQRLQLLVQQDGGTERLQRSLDSVARLNYGIELNPEDVWAYQQLGITVPPSIPVYRIPNASTSR